MSMKEEIFNKTRDLIKTIGVKKITVNDICTECSISRVTFYKHFKDKNDLIRKAVVSIFKKWNKEVEDVLFGDLEYEGKLKFLLNFKEKQIEEAGENFSRELLNPPEAIKDIVYEQKIFAMKQFDKFITKEKKLGLIDKSMPNEFIMLLAGHLARLSEDERIHQIIPSDKKRASTILKVLINGIMT